MKPAPSPVRKTRKRALRLPTATIAASQLALETSGSALEDRVGGHANGVLDAEELAELIEQWQGKTGIRAELRERDIRDDGEGRVWQYPARTLEMRS